MDYSNLLNGKVCIITGGARGQGFQEAILFKQHGGIVYITDILDGTDAAKSIGATYLKHDVTSESDWSDIVSKVESENGGRLDVLINNAGVFQKGNVLKETKEGFERLNAINTTGVFFGMKHAVAKSTVPLGRVADPMEVARLALFLSSEMSSYSTGSEFVVDGGNMGAAM